MNILDELKARGHIAQMTHEDEIYKLFDSGESVTFYIGFDPTAESVHIGSYIPLIVASHLQKAGHNPIMLFGGGTAMIGDPTGKTEMRKMLTVDEVNHNVECFKKQFSSLIDFSDGKAISMNNADWLLQLNYIDFIREIGVHFSVNKMLAAECYKQRIERGLSFFELNYMIMQSYDFLHLYRQNKCILQIGGDDQWSNILGGSDLIRRCEQGAAYGMTLGLLLKSDGEKMGKTASGAIWLDENKTSPYEFYQYLRNTDDADVISYLKRLTFVSLEEIAQFENLTGSQLNPVKKRLAFEVTKLIHGQEKAEQASAAAKSIFTDGPSADSMPLAVISASLIEGNNGLVFDVLLAGGIVPSKAEARRLVEQGGLTIDDVKITDTSFLITKEMFSKGYIVVKKGKKNYFRVEINE